MTTPSLKRAASLLAISLMSSGLAAAQAPVYVDADATGAGDGTSWSDAYNDLQTALASTASGEVWVAEGIYLPAGPTDPSTAFELRSGLALYGGFSGVETALDQRDPAAFPTVLSGDLAQDDTYGAFWNWWQFNWTGYQENSHAVVRATGVDATAVLDGFEIHAGFGSGPDQKGAGMRLENAAPTLANLVFEKNAYGEGSALYASASSPTIRGCTIRDGYSFGKGPSGFSFVSGSTALIEDCLFDNHYMVATFGQGRGGALYVELDSTATVRRSTFRDCQTGNWFAQGEPAGAYGAGIHNRGVGLLVEDCVFEDGFSHGGSGIYTVQDATVINSLFQRNLVVGYPVTEWLDHGDVGAGIAKFGTGTLRVEGCTFTENESDGGALYSVSASTAIVRNSILWGNVGHPQVPGEDPKWPLKFQLSGDFDLGWSDVQYLLQTEPGEDPPNPASYPGCIDADPLFAMPGVDASLAPGSPCIDAGQNAGVTAGILTDLAGAPRLADDPATPDTGAGTAPLVDMGAYEFGGPSPLLVAGIDSVSLSYGGTQDFSLSGGPALAGELYLLLGTEAGAAPGFVVDGVTIPLNPLGSYFLHTLTQAGSATHPGSIGTLDPKGRGSAALVLPAGLNPGLAGLVLQHAFVVFDLPGSGALSSASNAVALTLEP